MFNANETESAFDKEEGHMYNMESILIRDINGSERKSLINLLKKEASVFKAKSNISQKEKDYVEALETGVTVVDAFWNMCHQQRASL